ncbi:U4/U6.U5 tri-snRNP-associated protein [Achlya hypogyna]|uniref:U4/U6.U5 tri-snRNP-associated protein n=1 Tax=Achlya hypogyna TaxID=1202772 RepID=A0A1V9Y503_ACHHY|nr:U4/U6.U5 tri-snRNP-associated protein [Achlya hypogyna]
MSIEETNKLRISMGLKPLRLTKPEAKEVNLAKSREELAAEAQQQQLKEAIEKSKRKREYTAKFAGKSLGETLMENASSTLDWVRRSRTAPAPMTATTAKPESSASYSAMDLKGITVAHDAHAFEEGEEVILTLKDTRILTDDMAAVNDADDELENVTLAEADKRKEREEQAKRAAGPVYSGFDDDEFTTVGGDRPTKRLLTQYDEEEELLAARARKKFALSALGGHAVEPVAAPEPALGAAVAKAPKALDDYYTPEEMAVFRKKKTKKLRKKKARTTDDDAAELVQQLEAEASASAGDHGKREAAAAGPVAALEAQNRAKFEAARRRAAAKAMVVADDIDEELSASLALSRRQALQAKEAVESNEARVLSQVAAAVPADHIHRVVEHTVVFNEATDFDVRVKNALEAREASGDKPAARAPATADEEETKKVDEEVDAANDDDDDDGAWGVEEPLVQTGMAATLALLRNRGDLREDVQLRQAGRANDHRDRNFNDELQIKDGVKLDYRDEFGRLLTKKEAFRQISYRFHGHAPGKKKQEKRLKQLKEELATKKTNVSAKMQSLDRRQKQSKQAHLVLSEGT